MATAQNNSKQELKFFLLGCITTLLLVAIPALWRHTRATEAARAKTLLTAFDPAAAPPGGWIEAEPMPLAIPDGVLPDGSERLRSPKWFFEGFTAQRLVRFLGSCDLRPVQRRILLDPKCCTVTSNGCEIAPPDSLVWSLSGRARQQIYNALGCLPQNYAQRFPLRFAVEEFEQRLAGSGLNEQEFNLVRRLAYTNSGTICFTDLDAVGHVLPPERFNDLLEALYEVPAYILRVRVTPDSDIESLTRYWGKGGRERLIRPLFKALTKVPGGAVLNVNYLLPPFARLRLYTFPESWGDPTTAQQDCMFTAMNFFNDAPDTNFLEADFCQEALKQKYTPVTDAPAYGDVLLFLDESGQIMHACVFVVDEFVFTKNGINRAQPWVLMRMPDVLAIYYGPNNPGQMLILRRNDLKAV